jgi:hypothetical protein
LNKTPLHPELLVRKHSIRNGLKVGLIDVGELIIQRDGCRSYLGHCKHIPSLFLYQQAQLEVGLI